MNYSSADYPAPSAEMPEARLAALGIELPQPSAPVAAYLQVRVSGSTAFVSGQVPIRDGKLVHSGRLGADLAVTDGYDAARLAALNILAQLRRALGSLNRVSQVNRVAVLVVSTTDFVDHPLVANGASDLFVAVFGDAGRHARVAYGVAALPLGSSVEVEAQVAVRAGADLP
jgi:enamine deaminase RidA (YjgF/YER057c/UK114 family)